MVRGAPDSKRDRVTDLLILLVGAGALVEVIVRGGGGGGGGGGVVVGRLEDRRTQRLVHHQLDDLVEADVVVEQTVAVHQLEITQR